MTATKISLATTFTWNQKPWILEIQNQKNQCFTSSFLLSPSRVEKYLLMDITKRMNKQQPGVMGHLHVSNLKERVISCLELQIFLLRSKLNTGY